MQKRINGIFIWSYQKNIVPLHREPTLGMFAHQRRRVADIIKKAFISACFGIPKSCKISHAQSKVSNRRPLVCIYHVFYAQVHISVDVRCLFLCVGSCRNLGIENKQR